MLKGLKNIYAEAQEESPDTRISAPPSRSKIKIFLGLMVFFAVLGGVSWAGFSLFGGGQSFSEEKIELKINGPEQSYAGQNIAYRLALSNRQKIPLANATLELRYPDNFQFISAQPAPGDKENRRWDLGALAQNKGGLIEINGRILGAADSDQTLRAFLTYKPADFNAEFQKIATFSTRLNPLPAEFSLTGPDELSTGEEGVFEINLANAAAEPLNNLEISLDAPANFKFSSLLPLPAKEQKFWKISLLPQASSTFKVKGFFTAETAAGNPQAFTARLNLRDGENLFPQNTAGKNTNLSQSNLSLAILANQSTEKQAINFEDKIPFAVSYENTGNKSLKNVTVRAVLDAPFDGEKSVLNWPALEDKKDGAVAGEQRSTAVRRGVIAWNKAQIPGLAEIKPKDKGTIEFLLPCRPKKDLNLAKLSEAKITAYAEALVGQTKVEQPLSLQSQTLILVLSTDLNLSLQATIKEKKNLPTQVGQKYDTETGYSLTWTLTNSWHEITEVKLTATLPENVDWKNVTSVSAGEISFDPATKQVSWQINRVPISYPQTTISFEVGVKASLDDKGKEGMVLDKTRLEARDKATGENILFWKEAVMTIL